MPYDEWFDVLRLILDLKQGRRSCVIPIADSKGNRIGRLEPIGAAHLVTKELVRQFVRWRNQNRLGYLDQRPTTEPDTARWLIDVVTNPTRIAFLIYADETLVGRCGNVQMRPWELMSDGLVRGEQGGGMKFMHYAQISGILWTFCNLKMETIHSKVLSTNEMAIESCRSLGYDMQPFQSSPVYRKSTPDGDILEESGLPSELVPGVVLNYYRLQQAIKRVVVGCR